MEYSKAFSFKALRIARPIHCQGGQGDDLLEVMTARRYRGHTQLYSLVFGPGGSADDQIQPNET